MRATTTPAFRHRTPAVPVRVAHAAPATRVRCPHCRATRNFLTPDGAVMLRVLEDEHDTELLEEGLILYCEGCGDSFRCPANPAAAA